jgi:hypothetical protein
MVNQAGPNSEPTPAAIVPQVVKTPYQVASGNSAHKVSTVPFNGDRQRNKNNGMTPTPLVDFAKTKSVVGIAADPEPRKDSGLHRQSADSSELSRHDNLSDGDKGANAVNQASGLKGEELTNSVDPSEPESEREAQLVGRIDKLWSSHNKKSSSVKQSREELNRLRTSLSIELHAYKKLLVGTGRDGRWAPFLKERGIPLSTGDRYVKRQEDALARIPGKVLTEELPPTAAEVTQKVRKLAPGLIRFLTNPESVSRFMLELGAALQPSTPSA